MTLTEEKDEIAVQKLREYLRIKTVHPEPDYGMYSLLTAPGIQVMGY